MIAGIYSARFKVHDYQLGLGIVVIDGHSLHGGDYDYVYKGTYRLEEQTVSASVEVKNYSGKPNSVLGPIAAYRLNLTGVVAPHGFSLSGQVIEQPDLIVRIELIKIGELVDR